VTKFAAALLFVTLQVGIFTLACFLVLGVRGGAWLWGLFLTIPIMVCFLQLPVFDLRAAGDGHALDAGSAAADAAMLVRDLHHSRHRIRAAVFSNSLAAGADPIRPRYRLASEKDRAPGIPHHRARVSSSPATDQSQGWAARWLSGLVQQQEKKMGREATLAQAQQQLVDRAEKKD